VHSNITDIEPNIIAMGFPSVGFESLFRNPRAQVKRLLEKRHSSKYRLYNLCGEPKHQYPDSEFEGRVGRYPFADHQAPPLDLMGKFCKDVADWTHGDGNVAAIHCKAGKGRAGMMICCWLVHSGLQPDALTTMSVYAERRTKDKEGVTIPSQRRYVGYYDQIVHHGMPNIPKIRLSSITVLTSKYANPGRHNLSVEIQHLGKTIFKREAVDTQDSKDLTVDCKDLEISGDVKLILRDKALAGKKEAAAAWFNTAFIEGNVLKLTKSEIDKAWNDRKLKKFSP